LFRKLTHRIFLASKIKNAQIALAIVKHLRSLDPPARFLQKDRSTGLWNDVGDKKFREKVSQALREHQPFIKALMDIDDDDAPTDLHTEKRSRTESFLDLETIAEQSPSPSTGLLPDLCITENKRRAFATSRIEPVSALGNEDSLEGPVEHYTNITEFTVSDFTLSDGPFFTFPSSSMEDCLRGTYVFPAQQLPGDALSGWILEEKAFEDGRIERNAGRPFPPRDLVKRESSYDNETPETKRGFLFDGTVKRCVLNRNKSDVARNLKEFRSDFPTADQSRCEASEMDFLLDALGRSFVFP
jgi:hypothetical protein